MVVAKWGPYHIVNFRVRFDLNSEHFVTTHSQTRTRPIAPVAFNIFGTNVLIDNDHS